jgi:DNA-binding LytR/AlgR family response regulator
MIWQYLFWIFAEILFMSFFYALFEKFVTDDIRPFSDLIRISSKNTALVLLLPYSISWLFLAWQDKKEEIEKLAENQDTQPGTRDMIPFYDDKGVLKFSVKKENLLYLESAENYVYICYLNRNKVSKHMLRDTLKKIE